MTKKSDGKRLVKVIRLKRQGEDIHVCWNNQKTGENILIQDGATVRLTETVIEILKRSGEEVYEEQTVNEDTGERFKSKFIPNYFIVELEETENNDSQTPEQKNQAALAEALHDSA